MTKRYFGNMVISLLFVVIISPIAQAQENRNVNLSLSYGYYSFFKSTWVQELMVNNLTDAPSLTIDAPISNALSINSKLIYLYLKSDAVSNVISGLGTQLKTYRGTTTVKEILLFPKAQWIFYRRDSFMIAANIGVMLGYINEKFEFGNYLYGAGNKFDFGIVGIAGGLTVCNHLKDSPFSILFTLDSHYGSRGDNGDNSLLREYDGYLLSFGIGLDL